MVSSIMKKMIEFSKGSLHDINHFLKVHEYAKLIGELEELPSDKQLILEVAAMVHDIACPMLREKYGQANGKLQEVEGMPLAQELLQDTGLTDEQIARVVFLVGHHHTLDLVDDVDYQILLEADYLVNADESKYSQQSIKNACSNMFKTRTGKQLIESIYLK